MIDRVLRVRFKIADQSHFVERRIAAYDEPHLHSHVELQFSDGASFSARAMESGGQKKRNGTYYVRLDFGPSTWNTLELPVTEDEENLVREWCDTQDGEDYDFNGIAAFYTWLLHEDPNKWFCSEVVTAALQQIGLVKDLNPSKTSPDRLYTQLKEILH